jgi:hypothetical protein
MVFFDLVPFFFSNVWCYFETFCQLCWKIVMYWSTCKCIDEHVDNFAATLAPTPSLVKRRTLTTPSDARVGLQGVRVPFWVLVRLWLVLAETLGAVSVVHQPCVVFAASSPLSAGSGEMPYCETRGNTQGDLVQVHVFESWCARCRNYSAGNDLYTK